MRKFFFFLFIPFIIYSQQEKKINNQSLVWFFINADLKLNSNWTLNFDTQERVFVSPSKQAQYLFRSTVKRKLNDTWDLGVGFAYFLTHSNNEYVVNDLGVPELRPHLDFYNKQKFKYGQLSFRYRYEIRYFHQVENNELVGGFHYNNMRFRIQAGYQLPVLKLKELEVLKLKIADELMVNFGSKIVKNSFDQNRIYIGIQSDISKNLAFEVGYMNWFQEQANGVDYYNRDIIRLGVALKY